MGYDYTYIKTYAKFQHILHGGDYNPEQWIDTPQTWDEDTMMERVYENGGRVVLATPSGARPTCIAEKYTEVLRVNENGMKQLFGSLHSYCYNLQAKIYEINKKLAERYKDSGALIVWHVSNEYGGEFIASFTRTLSGNGLRKNITMIWIS